MTAYAIASSRFESASLWALDAKTGAPVEGAEFTLYPNNRRGDSSPKTIGKTNAEGSAACSSNGYVTLTKGTDRYANPLWIYSDDNKFEENGINQRPATAPCRYIIPATAWSGWLSYMNISAKTTAL